MSHVAPCAPRTRSVKRMIVAAAVAGSLGLVAVAPQANAAELFWSANGTTVGGGLAANATTGWNTANAHWGTSASGPFTAAWNNSAVDSATFNSPAGVVPINNGATSGGTTPITVNVIKTNIGGYSIGNGNSANIGNRISFSGAGAGINAQHSSLTTTLNANFVGTLLKTGPGRVELGSAGTPSDGTAKYAINAGFISFASAARLSAASPGTLIQDFITFDGGGLASGNGTAGDLGNRGITINAGGAFLGSSGAGTFAGANDMTISSPVVGVGGLTVTNAGPFYSPYAAAGLWQLTNSGNTYQGATTIVAGTLAVDGDATLGNGAGNLNLSGGRLAVTANRSVSTNPIPNPINVTADSVISSTATAATVNLNLSSNTVTGTGGTLTFRNEGAPAAQFAPRFSGSGFNMPRPIVLDNGAGTRTVQLSSFNTTGTQTFSGNISGGGSFNRSSGSTGGTTVFNGNNTYTGSTTVNIGTLTAAGTGANQALAGTSGISVNSAGILLLGDSDEINNTAGLTLNGGKFDTGGFDEGTALANGLGALTLSGAGASIIDMSTLGDSIIRFADSSAATWSAGTLNIYNWNGLPLFGAGPDQLYFSGSTSGLTLAQLLQINFYSDAGTTLLGGGGAQFALTGTGEIVPVPEPTGVALLAIGGGLGVYARRRRV